MLTVFIFFTLRTTDIADASDIIILFGISKFEPKRGTEIQWSFGATAA